VDKIIKKLKIFIRNRVRKEYHNKNKGLQQMIITEL
jgi:hypothetical protein